MESSTGRPYEPPEPGGRRPAPGPLRLIQTFVNTLDVARDQDSLGEPEELKAWLASRHLIPESVLVTNDALRNAREVREAIRELLLANNGVSCDPAAVSILTHVAADARLVPRLTGEVTVALEPLAPGVAGALGRLISVVFTSMLNGTWARLKACHNGTCQWAFYDRSKNRSGRWCAMGVCGNRIKARVYRLRRGGPGGLPTEGGETSVISLKSLRAVQQSSSRATSPPSAGGLPLSNRQTPGRPVCETP